MKNSESNHLPVELHGGPLDGHRDVVPMPEFAVLDVHLFARTSPTEKVRCAYRFANRTTKKGRWWVMEFVCVVSRWKAHSGKC